MKSSSDHSTPNFQIIRSKRSSIVLIQEPLGSSLSTAKVKKILAYTRCAGLAAQNYQALTSHDSFCSPVIEDGAEDESEPPHCQFERKPDSREGFY
jgi:hypothetical protein